MSKHKNAYRKMIDNQERYRQFEEREREQKKPFDKTKLMFKLIKQGYTYQEIKDYMSKL